MSIIKSFSVGDGDMFYIELIEGCFQFKMALIFICARNI